MAARAPARSCTSRLRRLVKARASSRSSVAASVSRWSSRTSRSLTGPSRPPSQPSSARSGSAHSGATRPRAARSRERDRRAATRSWWRASGSSPSLTPGSFASIVSYCVTRSERSRSTGSPFTRARSGRVGARTRWSFGMPSPRRAPALRSALPSRPRGAVSPATTSASISVKESARRCPSRTSTLSITTSIRLGPSATVTPLRRVRSFATGWRPLCARSSAGRRRSSGSGGRDGPPVCSSSSRPSSAGSFSCQTPAVFSTRRRRVIPERSSRRSGVS